MANKLLSIKAVATLGTKSTTLYSDEVPLPVFVSNALTILEDLTDGEPEVNATGTLTGSTLSIAFMVKLGSGSFNIPGYNIGLVGSVASAIALAEEFEGGKATVVVDVLIMDAPAPVVTPVNTTAFIPDGGTIGVSPNVINVPLAGGGASSTG